MKMLTLSVSICLGLSAILVGSIPAAAESNLWLPNPRLLGDSLDHCVQLYGLRDSSDSQGAGTPTRVQLDLSEDGRVTGLQVVYDATVLFEEAAADIDRLYGEWAHLVSRVQPFRIWRMESQGFLMDLGTAEAGITLDSQVPMCREVVAVSLLTILGSSNDRSTPSRRTERRIVLPDPRSIGLSAEACVPIFEAESLGEGGLYPSTLTIELEENRIGALAVAYRAEVSLDEIEQNVDRLYGTWRSREIRLWRVLADGFAISADVTPRGNTVLLFFTLPPATHGGVGPGRQMN